jgi:hypothetical protein
MTFRMMAIGMMTFASFSMMIAMFAAIGEFPIVLATVVRVMVHIVPIAMVTHVVVFVVGHVIMTEVSGMPKSWLTRVTETFVMHSVMDVEFEMMRARSAVSKLFMTIVMMSKLVAGTAV